MEVHHRIRRLRERNGISREEFAKTIGVTYAALSKYETGKRQLDFDTLERIADYFEVTTDYLLGRSDLPNKKNSSDETEKSFFASKIATEFPDIELMFKDMESLSAEDMKEVYDYIKFKKSQKKGDEK